MHSDDVVTHLKEARELLKPAERYLFDTPHPSSGSHDLSLAFGFDRPHYMHLREYALQEMCDRLRVAGYSRIEVVFHVPGLA